MRLFIFSLLASAITSCGFSQQKILVFQSDFGVKDGAVSAMKGVAISVSPDLHIFDVTHEIPPFNIWEAAYRLDQAARYWPAGTVFVSVVDPGVGSERKSIVAKSKTGHFFVTPDNGTLTLVAKSMGIEEVRVIDEKINRLPGSAESYTFHGRDVYAFTGARLASGVIAFEKIGPLLEGDPVLLPYRDATLSDGVIEGTIDILDVQYGNVWTNIGKDLLDKLRIRPGNTVNVTIRNGEDFVYEGTMMLGNTFSEVRRGESIAYVNSLMNFSFGINQGNFASDHKISAGNNWSVQVKKVR